MAEGIDQWLRSSYGITCGRQWLEACVSWIREQRGGAITSAHLRDSVYSQWLHTDLRESRDTSATPSVGNCCLPPQVFQSESGEINGRYIVQVESVINVGTSSYSQLQRIKGLEIDDGDDTETRNRGTQNYSNKLNRMLFISLTDGCGLIHAMEYQPISQLSVATPPGTKLKLEGLIKYRLGVMLMVERHVTVMGGAVEDLANENSEKNVLLKNLNITEDNSSREAPPTDPPPNNPRPRLSSTNEQKPLPPPNVGVAQPHFNQSTPSVICLDTPPKFNQQDVEEIEYIDLLSESPKTGADNEEAELTNNEGAGLYTSFNNDQPSYDILNDTDWDEFYDFDDFTPGDERVNTHIPVNEVFQTIAGKPSTKVYCKASVRKLEGELTRGTSDWSIGAVITDNNGDLPVTIGNDPIQALTGFTLAEYRAKGVPTVQMRQGLLKCNRTLLSLHCVMELQWIQGNVTVTKLIDKE